MPKQSPDQPSYSVDEMMEKLREGEREKEERANSRLVTRPDGSQVLKVRKRKRRSRQPQREAEERKKKRGLLWISIVFGIFVLLGIVVVLLVARCNSRGFQEELAAKAGETVGGKVYLNRLAVTPMRARLQEMSFRWPESYPMRYMKLSNVSADLRITSLFGADWNGEEVFAQSGVLRLGPPGDVSPTPLPEPRFEFSQFRCGNLNLAFGEGDHPPVVLRGTEATLRPSEDGVTKMLFKRGELVVSGWDPMPADFGAAIIDKGAFVLRSFRVKNASETGELEFRTSEPYRKGAPLMLAVDATDFSLAALLGPELGKLVDATIAGKDGTVTVEGWDFESLDGRLEFKGRDGRLREFIFLKNLRTIFGDTDFGKPHFAEVSGVFRRDRYGVRIQNLEMEHAGQLVVRGTVEYTNDGGLAGKLQLGIRESRIMAATGRKRYPAFSDPANGYCWITIELSGTADDPRDNFSAILHRGPGGAGAGGGLLEGGLER